MERNEGETETKERGLSFTSETVDVQEKREKNIFRDCQERATFRGDL